MPKREPRPIRFDGDIAFVPLSQGHEAIIDAEDAPLLLPFFWNLQIQSRGKKYAIRSRSKSHGAVLMHRLLINAPAGMQVDHKDGDGLNNRKSNLRLATPSLNNANRLYGKKSSINAKGTQLRYGRYQAQIKLMGKRYVLGTFDTEEEASAAYFNAAKALFGEFACRGKP